MSGWIIFVLLSVPIVYVSRASLRSPRSHGFYRFFAWELILALAILNVAVWFDRPFSWNQIVSWFLLVISCVPLAFGVHALRSRGRPAGQREGDPTLIAFERTTSLVTTGVYRYIRHPLYSSLLFLAWGIFFKDPSWLGAALAIAATAALFAMAKADEAECIRFFGPEYAQYMKTSERFVPFLF